MSAAKFPIKTLRELAFRCGLPQTGTKPVLSARLKAAATEFTPVPADIRVLSIDLGLRNFAFSLLTVPRSSPLRTTSKTLSSKPARNQPPLVALHAWRHINLLLDTGVTGAEKLVDEGFSPSAMAQRTVQLVREQLLPLRPTHVLIERQRFRSAGQAAVQEWTLRVNTLEAMLYAAFATVRVLGGGWDGSLLAVPPSRVVRYLLGEEGIGEALFVERRALALLPEAGALSAKNGAVVEDGVVGTVTKKATNKDHKRKKIALLERALSPGSGTIKLASDEAQMMVEEFFAAGDKSKTRKSKKKAKEVGRETAPEIILDNTSTWVKRDDLSDCLLQGLVWLEWQRNIAEVRKTIF